MTDYGYGYEDAQPDYGYGDEDPQPEVAEGEERKGPKRRNSCTRYSLDEKAQTQSGQAERINQIRTVAAEENNKTPATVSDSENEGSGAAGKMVGRRMSNGKDDKPKKKEGVMGRIKKRLSIGKTS
jgi:hypothetical protein